MLLWEAVGGKKPQQSSTKSGVVRAVTTRRLRSIQAEDRCSALTRIGRRCRCRRARGSEFCNFHDPEIAAQIRERARLKREDKKRQLALLPDGFVKSLNSVDGIATALDSLYREVRLGVVSPRTASVMLAIIDRLLVYEKLVATVGKRRVTKRQRAFEVRQQLAEVLQDLKLPEPARPVKTSVVPAAHQAVQNLTAG